MADKRIRIRISEEGDDDDLRALFCLEEPTAGVPDPTRLRRLDCDVSSAPFSELAEQVAADQSKTLVQDVGSVVYQRLTVHDGVKAALDQARNSVEDDPCSILIELRTQAAEALPFETLFAEKFLALDDRFPIVRVPLWGANLETTVERLCRIPLRATLVISAAGLQNYEESEWRGLRDAFVASGVEHRLQVFVGRPDLYDQIEAEGNDNVDLHLIGDDMTEDRLMRTVGEFEPTLLHFFCHGRTSPKPYLEVATEATHESSEEPLYVASDEIRGITQSLCLLTLNACSSAEAVTDAYALALSMSKDGVPAVVGMREPIEAGDANLFSQAFYEAVLRNLDQLFTTAANEAPNWSQLMHEPRLQLCQGAGPRRERAASDKRWTLPVLYVRPERLRIQTFNEMHRPDLSAEAVTEAFGELTMLRKFLADRHQNTPAGMLNEINTRIQELEAMLVGPAEQDTDADEGQQEVFA